MRLPALAVLSLLLAQPALAETIDTASIVTAVTGDFNKDGEKDLALLARGQEDMDLHLLLGVAGRGFLKPAEVIKGKVWGVAGPGDDIVGEEPSLEALPNGSLAVYTRNEAIGRSHWTQKLTLAFRNDTLVVAGFFYQWLDTLNPSDAGRCDINILTGKGVRETFPEEGDPVKKTIAIKGQQPRFADWNEDKAIAACGLH
jgi:hypothetical protein